MAEYSYLLGALAGILNFFMVRGLVVTEVWAVKSGRLPQWRNVLRLKDYTFFMWGDRIFVTFLDIGAVVVVAQAWPLPLTAFIVCFLGAAVWAAFWHRIYLNRTRTFDTAYPETGKVSILGRVHLAYFWYQYALGGLGLWALSYFVTGHRPWSGGGILWAVIGLTGVACYFFTLWWDAKNGRSPDMHLVH